MAGRYGGISGGLLALGASFALCGVALAQADSFTVRSGEIDDLKAVYATVRSKDRIEARVRTPGTVVSLKVDEGRHVEPGQVLATVADPKIALKMRALDAQIVGLESRVQTAAAELERVEQLKQRGVSPQARVDQVKTAFDVATNELKSARAERLVAEQQVEEGQVLAPAAGRVLKVPVTEGSVVMAGESIATIAANAYLLRLELPERHARFMKVGDTVRLGERGLGSSGTAQSTGRIFQVYPELQGGRVLADAEVQNLGDYFVGERTAVWISAGKRTAFIIPEGFSFRRFGLDFVRVKGAGGAVVDTVVQLGEGAVVPGGARGVEVLAGLKDGDVIVRPESKS
ncbi:MAG TPA: efflux RND transporter periplasmic adaptor subunit [Hyphomicrobiaceae bacterium]|nr:efflux RND transporter periplasmic adaptor subunit [Hyphomicrobiaceae bacterium]